MVVVAVKTVKMVGITAVKMVNPITSMVTRTNVEDTIIGAVVTVVVMVVVTVVVDIKIGRVDKIGATDKTGKVSLIHYFTFKFF